MATFDLYLITSRNVNLRQLTTKRKQTKQIILFLIILFLIHSIPNVFYFDVSNSGRCFIISKVYLYYYLWIFQIFLHSIIPIICLTIFGTLTFIQLKNIKQNKSRNIDKQISRMLLLMSLAIILSSIPYCIEHVYYVIISNDRLNQTSFIFLYHIITSILFYTNPVTSFYIFYISTPNFRKQVKKIIFCKNQ